MKGYKKAQLSYDNAVPDEYWDNDDYTCETCKHYELCWCYLNDYETNKNKTCRKWESKQWKAL